MATDTPAEVRNLVIYQVFPRNHGPHGTLTDVTADLERIADLGVDYVYLLPVHPIGEVGRKGSLGSPYAIRDYRTLHPDLGTEEDMAALITRAHDLGLGVMVDIVFNHTAHDSILVEEHPEFFHTDAEGKPMSSVPAWSDIIDFRHPHPEIDDYLLDCLRQWVVAGVDGFRCDVATLVPLAFWQRARAELAQLRPGLLWLAETVHPMMVEAQRAEGRSLPSDGEMFTAFDIEYSYDIWGMWQAAVTGQMPVGRYLELLRWQEVTGPANAARLRYVENHDNYRIMGFAPSRDQAIAWTTLAALSPGPFMVYAGQESGATRWPSLFEPDPVSWGDDELSWLVTALAGLKKHPALVEGTFVILDDEPCVQLAWGTRASSSLGPVPSGDGLYGVVNVSAFEGEVAVQLPDGDYPDLIGGGIVRVFEGTIPAPETAVVLAFDQSFEVDPWQTPLLDLFLHVEVLGQD